MVQRSSGQLLRVLGPAFTIAVGLGTVIGGGILRTPATVLDAVPDTRIALLLWVALGFQSLIEANSVAEVMTLFPRSGGYTVPAREAFGEPGGLLVGWTDWLNYVAAIAALAILSAEFLAMIAPALAPNKVTVALLLLAALTGLNAIGVREGGGSQILGSILKTLFLLGVIVAILLFIPSARAVPAPSHSSAMVGWAGLVLAYQTIFGAYTGWNNAGYFAGEDVDPGRNVPRGMFVTIFTTSALFILMTVALNHALPLETLRHSTLPIADALTPRFGRDATVSVAIGALLITVSCCNANLMAAPRILLALAETRLFPSFALVVNRGGTPWIALSLTFFAAAVLVLTGSFETVFIIMAALALIPQLLAELALFKLRHDYPDVPRPWRARFYPWLPALAVLLDLGLLGAFIVADPTSGLFVVGAAAIALPIGIVMQRRAPRVVS